MDSHIVQSKRKPQTNLSSKMIAAIILLAYVILNVEYWKYNADH
jgi:hypothetical protein